MDRMRDTSPHRDQAACCRNTQRQLACRACRDDRPLQATAQPRATAATAPGESHMTYPFAIGAVVGPCVITVVTTAAAQDLRRRRIPNWLTFGAWLLALPVQCAMHGAVSGLFEWSGGWLAGLGLLLPLYLMRGMAAGDVKLMAAVGAWLGAPMAVQIALVAFVIGGVWALVQTLAAGQWVPLLRNLRLMLASAGQIRPQRDGTGDPAALRSVGSIPYGVAIAIGTVGVLFATA